MISLNSILWIRSDNVACNSEKTKEVKNIYLNIANNKTP